MINKKNKMIINIKRGSLYKKNKEYKLKDYEYMISPSSWSKYTYGDITAPKKDTVYLTYVQFNKLLEEFTLNTRYRELFYITENNKNKHRLVHSIDICNFDTNYIQTNGSKHLIIIGSYYSSKKDIKLDITKPHMYLITYDEEFKVNIYDSECVITITNSYTMKRNY